MASLSAPDLKILDRVFNSSGYVLDFSTERFDAFTERSVGIPLCETYGLSKGKSLEKFFLEGEDAKVRYLILDLLDYYENLALLDDTYKNSDAIVARCQKIAENLGKSVALPTQLRDLQTTFNTEYIDRLVEAMQASIEDFPTDAIGKSKELLESCYKTILLEQGIEFSSSSDVSDLSKEVYKLLKLAPEGISEEKRARGAIKKILGSLATVSVGIVELRNPHGTGHGKERGYRGLSARHARLAVGAAATVTYFVWETYQELKERGELQL